MTETFSSFVRSKKFDREKIVKFLKKIETPTDAITLDLTYPGVFYTYEIYETSKRIEIARSHHLDVYEKDGTITTLEISEQRASAELTVQCMALNATGARPGEVINGIHNTSRGSVLKVMSGVCPVMKDDLDKVRMFPELWTVLINKLGNLEFFRDLTPVERATWLYENQRSGDYDLAEVDELCVEVIDVGKGKFLEIEEDALSSLVGGRTISVSDLRDMFPRKPGSKAKRNTLVFFLWFWRLSIAYSIVSRFDGPVYSFEEKKVVKGKSVKGQEIIVFEKIPCEYSSTGKGFEVSEYGNIGVVLQKSDSPTITKERCFACLADYYGFQYSEAWDGTIEEFQDSCKNFTPAGYKSLLQKFIRYRPVDFVSEGGRSIPSKVCLSITFTLLLLSPGSFVPDIQRFVSGQESAVKRLLVSILEDSYCLDDSVLLKLAVMSMLCQRLNGWKMTMDDYVWALEVCGDAIETRKYYDYSFEKGFDTQPYVISSKNSVLQNMSAILDDVRSFTWDLAMARDIARTEGSCKKGFIDRPPEMRVAHCIDHHWAPEVVFLLPLEIVDEYSTKGSKPYSTIFQKIFHEVTGINPRKSDESDSVFVAAVKKAQQLVIRAKQNTPMQLKKTVDTYTVKADIDVSWIAGLVGPIDVPGKPPVMVTMRPEDPLQLVAIRKPARGMKDGTLTDERIEGAIERAQQSFVVDGVSLTSATPPIPKLKEYRLTKDPSSETDEYVFVRGKKTLRWKQLSHFQEEIDILRLKKPTLEASIKYGGEGMVTRGFLTLEAILQRLHIKVLRRLSSYLASNRTEIEIVRVSRDGGGTAQAVMIEDVGACQAMLYISFLFPSAIERVVGYVSKFKVKLAPLLWKVKTIIRDVISFMSIPTVSEILSVESGRNKWKKLKDTSSRNLRDYQKESLEEMKQKSDTGKKGHFLWLVVGLGKTMVVLEYLRYLIREKRMPKYIVYTLPKSALASIITEVEYYGGEINLLQPITSWKKHPKLSYIKDPRKVLPFHINIIEHDHLRLLSEELIGKASETVLVIDEVHKALNDTKRTSIALELSRLSQDFVALTGTPVVDSNTYKLIWWFEQIVDFEVNEKNFWVAANGMIAKKVNTGVSVDDQEVLARMTDEESARYRKLVPVSLGGTNSKPSGPDIREAFELCFDVCDRTIISETVKFLEEDTPTMVVARNSVHQRRLQKMLIKKGLREKEIFLLEGKDSIFITDEAVAEGKVPDYKVIIVPKDKSEGYTATRMGAMVTGVYFSNNAVREQLRGRINRLCQRREEIYYRTVHIGILSYTLKRYNDAASLSAAMSALAKDVNVDFDF